MDFSTWSPSTLAIILAAAFIGQIAILLLCTGRLGKRLNKQLDDIRKLCSRLEDRIDKGINDFNQPVVGIRKELSDVRIAISKMSESPIKYLRSDNQVLEHRPEPRKGHSAV